MSYQVLARKWRPGSFADMVGQDHVVKALSNALEREQLHHAYLFTGTRGVGKTTLARILSKALNCESGVTPRPCGRCSACREIDEGRFVDLLEVDAASRTKVDQTRELLDNVPFAPVKGRFKVYLIDEVHMFSTHSFNALLKTLEEPPTHVKFLLATTDPQKLPATVLSRCLRFNLKRLVPQQIADRFATILAAEDTEYEPQALTLLAHAADGSMRDGLSLLDQAIAFGGGRVATDEVRTLLGTAGRELSLDLLQTLAKLDQPGLLDQVARIADLTPDFSGVLQELIRLLHRIALHQQVPATLGTDDPNRERIADLSGQLTPEDVQLFYQIALLGQQDLPLAPDPRTGIEMVLLRMLVFRPDSGDETGGCQNLGESPVPKQEEPSAAPTAARPATGAETPKQDTRSPVLPPLPTVSIEKPGAAGHAGEAPTPPETTAIATTTASGPEPQGPMRLEGLRGPEDWHHLVADLKLGGLASQLANHCELTEWDGRRLSLTLDPAYENLRVASTEERLQGALTRVLGSETQVRIRIAPPKHETLAQRQARRQARHRAQAETLLAEDPVVEALRNELGAQWIPDSIEPIP